MDESAVFGHVIDELETRDYQPLVHVPGAHEDTYADVLDRCETHQITIGGRYPDGFGFTHVDPVPLPDESLYPAYISQHNAALEWV